MDVKKIKRRLGKLGPQGRGIEVKRISTLSGISQRTIRRYLDVDDPIVPSLGFIVAVCRYYGISMDQIILSGRRLADTDIGRKWRIFSDWWGANLTDEEKAAFMLMIETTWAKALKRAAANPNLTEETTGSITHQKP